MARSERGGSLRQRAAHLIGQPAAERGGYSNREKSQPRIDESGLPREHYGRRRHYATWLTRRTALDQLLRARWQPAWDLDSKPGRRANAYSQRGRPRLRFSGQSRPGGERGKPHFVRVE